MVNISKLFDLKKLGKFEIVSKLHGSIKPSDKLSSQKYFFDNTSKGLRENRNLTFCVVHNFTLKVEFFSNTLPVLVFGNSFLLLTRLRSIQI